MPTVGSYEFNLASFALNGFVDDDRAHEMKRGEWAWIDRGEFGLMIYAMCPDCGNLMTLYRKRGDQEPQGHKIDNVGGLHPSVLHSYKEAGVELCGFHTMPTRLLGFVDKRQG